MRTLHLFSRTATALLLLSAASSAVADDDPVELAQIGKRRLPITISGRTVKLPYWGNQSLLTANHTATRAVIVIHGADRAALKVYESMCAGLRLVDGTGCSSPATDTMVFSLQFLEEQDLRTGMASDLLFWKAGHWKYGIQSHSTSDHFRHRPITSYAVVDRVVKRLSSATRFSSLKTIVVAGQSGGGQFVNRYAAGNSVEPFANARGIALRYIVANSSSYLYFDNKRVTPGTTDQFSPYDPVARDCATFNDYQHGLHFTTDYPTNYIEPIPQSTLRANYASRDVVILLGEDDHDACDSGMSNGCEDKAQGRTRLARGLNYYNYLGETFTPGIYSRHRLEVVPGQGHGSKGIYTSAAGVRYIFDHGSVYSVPPVPSSPETTAGVSRPEYVWFGLPGAILYRVEVRNPSGIHRLFWVSRIAAGCPHGGRCRYTPAITLPNGRSYWRVRGYINGAYRHWSAWMGFDVGRPQVPQPVSPSGGSIVVRNGTWLVFEAEPGAVEYYVQARDASGDIKTRRYAAASICGCIKTCRVRLPSGMSPGTATWRVKAKNAKGQSLYSPFQSFYLIGVVGKLVPK